MLFQVTSWGFVQESFDALVDGIVEAVAAAHSNLRDGSMHANVGEVDEANINRSPTAYDRNPDEEKAQYVRCHHFTTPSPRHAMTMP